MQAQTHATQHGAALYDATCPGCQKVKGHLRREIIARIVLAEIGEAIGIEQDTHVGQLNKPSPFWFALINRKLGEAAAAYLSSAVIEMNHGELRTRLIEMASICVQFIEALDGTEFFTRGETP